MRLLAATAVIIAHTSTLNGHPSWRLGHIDFGEFGVGAFFVVSGYLITASFERSHSLAGYFRSRLLRLGPGLLASLVVTAFVMGPIATSLPPGEYFAQPRTYLYVVRNALLYPATYTLPGIFPQNTVAGIANGSLWTLRYEFTCYIAVAVLGSAGRLSKGNAAALAAGLAALAIGARVLDPVAALAPSGLVRALYLGSQNGFLFACGALLHLRGRGVPWWAALASAGLLATPLWVFGLPLTVIWAGSLKTVRLPADLSYGLYIYAFPIQQLLAAHGALTFWASMACTVPIAALSWCLVEKPALSLKHRRPANAMTDATAGA